MRLLITILSLLLSVSCDKLDDQENRKRLQECGRSNRTWEIVDWYISDYWPPWPFKGGRHKRVSNGEQVSSHEAPWIVLVNFTAMHSGEPRPHWTTGNMISTRHILSDSSVLLDKKYDNTTVASSWIWRFNGSQVDVSKCTKTGYLEVPEEAVKDMFIRVCKATQVCEAGTPYTVKKAWYIGLCHEKIESFGHTLLELHKNMEDITPYHRLFPVCLPPKDLEIKVNDTLRLYALGPRNTPEYNEHVAEGRFYADIRRGDTPAKSCYWDNGNPYYSVSIASVCLVSNVCHGDIGGAYVKEMEGGRMVAVAMARNGICGYYRTQPQPAVQPFLTQICHLSGICHVDLLNSTESSTTLLPTTTTTQKSINTTTITTTTTRKSIDITTTTTTTEKPIDTSTQKPIIVITSQPTDKPITESINTAENQHHDEPQLHLHVQNGKQRFELFVIFMISMTS